MTLPEPAATLARRWGFAPRERLPDGYCSHLWANEEWVFKVPFQGEELDSGFRAAIAFQRIGGPRVQASDPESGIALLERLIPGSPLGEAEPDEARRLEVFVHVVKRLRAAFPEPWDRPMPLAEYVAKTPGAQALLDSTPAEGALHGDLHPFNILRHGESWRPIDPKGLWGDPHYEAAAWLRNLLPEEIDAVGPLTEWRIGELAARLHLDPHRIAAWALEDAQDGDPICSAVSHAEYIRTLKNLV